MANLNCFENLCKYGICIFSALFMFVGVLMIGVAVYVIVVTGDIMHLGGEGYRSVAVLLLVLGFFVTALFLLGCCGMKKENGCMVLTFALVLGVILIMELVAGISAYMLRNETEQIFENTLENSFKKYANTSDQQQMWDRVQQDLHCCGLNDSSDYPTILNHPIPDSCCEVSGCNTTIKDNIFKAPCSAEIKTVLLDNITMAAKWAIAAACFHLFFVLSACYLGVQFRNRGSYENV